MGGNWDEGIHSREMLGCSVVANICDQGSLIRMDFFHGKALGEAAQGGDGFPREHLDVHSVLWAGIGHSLDSVISQAFSSLTDPVILTCVFLKIGILTPQVVEMGKTARVTGCVPLALASGCPCLAVVV